MSLEDLRNTRIEKLEKLRAAGADPYPASCRRDRSLAEAIAQFDELAAESDLHLVGRITAIRGQGGLVFFNIDDGTASLQALLKRDEMDEKLFDLFAATADIGDFVEITGKLFTTKRGEKTLQVSGWRMLAKSLRPLPEKWHGLADEEERFRKRYLDIIADPAVRELFIKKSKFWQSVRNFLAARGFMEVETPVLENTAGGAEARPFITHYNAYDTEVFLRISPELWLKRLLVAGYPKVFEIGRIFRNEGADAEHLQDYTQMEFYWAYADYRAGMQLVEEMYRTAAMDAFGTLAFKIRGFDIDLDKPWETYDFVALLKEQTGVDIRTADVEEIESKLEDLKIEYEERGFNRNRGIDALWKYCRKKIAGPGFLVNVPVDLEPLAKRSAKDPGVVERFQVILAGSEMGKGFSELNDPLDQRARFDAQASLRAAGDEEAQMTDADFIEALEYGMPPACGFGFSERLFSFLADLPAREAQIFPFMRPRG